LVAGAGCQPEGILTDNSEVFTGRCMSRIPWIEAD
jgi:hypothetical protein